MTILDDVNGRLNTIVIVLEVTMVYGKESHPQEIKDSMHNLLNKELFI
jgi:hypothetical protein